MNGNTDQACQLITDTIASALRKLSRSIQIVACEAPMGEEGRVEFIERDTEREWYIAIQLNSDPTGDEANR